MTKDYAIVKFNNNWLSYKVEISFQSDENPNLPLKVICHTSQLKSEAFQSEIRCKYVGNINSVQKPLCNK